MFDPYISPREYEYYYTLPVLKINSRNPRPPQYSGQQL